MATVLDFGLLNQFADVFAWVLIFVVMYAILQAVPIFPSRGVNALISLAVTVLLFTTGGTTTVIQGLIPWFVIAAFFVLFLLVLANFVGVPTNEVVDAFAGRGVVWWFFTALIVGLVISLVAGGQLSRGDTNVDPVTGEEIATPGRNVINILTEPKVLGFVLILSISAISIALMSGAPKLLH